MRQNSSNVKAKTWVKCRAFLVAALVVAGCGGPLTSTQETAVRKIIKDQRNELGKARIVDEFLTSVGIKRGVSYQVKSLQNLARSQIESIDKSSQPIRKLNKDSTIDETIAAIEESEKISEKLARRKSDGDLPLASLQHSVMLRNTLNAIGASILHKHRKSYSRFLGIVLDGPAPPELSMEQVKNPWSNGANNPYMKALEQLEAPWALLAHEEFRLFSDASSGCRVDDLKDFSMTFEQASDHLKSCIENVGNFWSQVEAALE